MGKQISFTAMAMVMAMMALALSGCATRQCPLDKAENRPVLAYSFQVTTWEDTTFAGMPFHVKCRNQTVDQWFKLRAKVNGQYLPNVGKGFLQAYGIVWIDWPEAFKAPTRQTVTFELWTDGIDLVGIKSASLIADAMFDWRGDQPINPPEE